MRSPLDLVRPDLRAFTPYEHAVYDPRYARLHANESRWRHAFDATASGLNTYPDPQPSRLIERLADVYGLSHDRVLLTRGSDDGIDVLCRAFCRAGEDRVVICPPTFGMYAVAARIQGAGVVEAPLDAAGGFELDAEAVIAAVREGARLVFLCSPNNPTGNALEPAQIEGLCGALADDAIVVVDEAYGEFSRIPSALTLLEDHPNLIVLRTLSKAYALAGARLGLLCGARELLRLLRALLPPYPIPTPSLAAVEALLEPAALNRARAEIVATVSRRERLAEALTPLASVRRVWPSEANFLLVGCRDAERAKAACRERGLLVRDFSSRPGLEGCLRLTVGDEPECEGLVAAFEAVA
jgi:histidinol-phosphate aminotransferase